MKNRISDPRGITPVAALVRGGTSFLICGHVRPDPDCIGSQLALARGLSRLGKRSELWLADPVPENCRFLPGSERIRTPSADGRAFDAAFVLDTPRPERLGVIADLVRGMPVTVNVDHHPSNTRWAAHNVVDPHAGATAELIHALLAELGVSTDRDIAVCLYAGLLTDTGRFCYSNTTPGIHRMAAELIEAGVKPEKIAENIYASARIQKIRLLARVLATLERDGALAWIRLTQAMYRESGASPEDAEGFVNYARDLEGIRVALLFEEGADGGSTRVSMRSRDARINVDRIAGRYGGGGHGAAAGAVVPGRMEDVERRVLDDVRNALGGA
ncbi:MAG: bifunctional oligoribonuclease/PAP phosphatase NrnA [Candidatus Aureabacteria bacterium]|nr:bifunctional oligoribonuclease/PAP phosphatase NrnA [Candidatus Auribacterota bacterium]